MEQVLVVCALFTGFLSLACVVQTSIDEASTLVNRTDWSVLVSYLTY